MLGFSMAGSHAFPGTREAKTRGRSDGAVK